LGIAGTSNAMGLEGLGGTNIGAGGVLSGVEGLGGTNKSAGGVESGLEFLTSSGDASATGAGVGTEGLGRLPEDYFEAGYDAPKPDAGDIVPATKTTTQSQPNSIGDRSNWGRRTPNAGALPFKTAEEGNAFRAWVNEYHSDIARKHDLDRTGSYNNRYITDAWAELGGAYKQR
jgi:hypothetical protein